MGDGTVFIDLTSDTVTASALQSGITAHDKSGAVITGTALEPETTALVKEDFDNNGGIIKDIFTVGDIPLVVTDTLDSGGGTIRTITADNVINLQAKKENMATASVTVVGDSGYDGLSKVIASFSPNNQDKTATPSNVLQEITFDSEYSGLGVVTVEAIPSEYVIPSGSFLITENGAGYDIAQYATVDVNVSGGSGGGVVNQTKTAIPSEIQQVITYDSGYTGLESVTISAIPSSYVGTGVARKSSTDLTVSDATVTAPAGYYESAATVSVVAGSAGTPTAIKGTVSSNSISITPSVTNTTGYITGGTINGAAVSVTANELVSGTKNITASGSNIDVTNYASVSVKAIDMQYVEINALISKNKTTHIATITPYAYFEEDGWFEEGEYDGTAKTVTASDLVDGTKSITSNGTGIDVTNYASVDVSVSAPSPSLQTKTKSYTPTESVQTETVSADSGYDGLSEVEITVGAISSTYIGSGIDRNDSTDLIASGDTVTVPSGYYSAQASKSITSGSATTPATTITANPTISINSSTGVITAVASESMSVTPTVSAGYVSSGTAGTISVSGSNTSELSTQAGTTISPTESEQTAVAAGKYTTGAVKVGAISSTYVGSGISQRSSSDLTASGAMVTVPEGYYSSQATKSVSNGSATPTDSLSATGATISAGTNTLTFSKTISNTPTVSAGYVSTGTSGNTAVSLTATVSTNSSASLTRSGATITAPAGYYAAAASSAVPTGTATAPSTISGTSATVTTGTNTLTLTKTVSVTPTVSTAGYISSGTAGNASVSLTASVTTKAAATITPGTSNQTIASGTYLTGTQTISGDANLVAGNIKSGTSIFGVNGTYSGLDTSDATASAADIVNGKTAYADGRKVEGSLIIQKYYTGSSVPSSSLGNNGDIYFQS